MGLAAGDLRARSMAGYDVVRRLAEGGMAEVHLARQVSGHMERLVVLKVPLAHLADETTFLRMFRAEASLAAQLSHPNIVSILDVADVDGLPCIVMEYLQGLDLREAMIRLGRAGQRVPAGIAVMVALGTALGLGYAHRKKTADGKPLGIVHRDVSPHNIFLTRDGGVKLLDFGVAKSATQIEKTKTGVVKGKLAYLAPEQLTTNVLDGRTDQWSLGVVLWEMLCGRRLFRREGGEAQVLNAVLNDPIAPPSSMGAPPDLDRIVLRCLNRKPDGRYPTCDALAADLQVFLRDAGAPPDSLALADFVEQLEPSRASARPDGEETLDDVDVKTISASASIPSGLALTSVSASGFEVTELPLDAPDPWQGQVPPDRGARGAALRRRDGLTAVRPPPPIDEEAERVTRPGKSSLPEVRRMQRADAEAPPPRDDAPPTERSTHQPRRIARKRSWLLPAVVVVVALVVLATWVAVGVARGSDRTSPAKDTQQNEGTPGARSARNEEDR